MLHPPVVNRSWQGPLRSVFRPRLASLVPCGAERDCRGPEPLLARNAVAEVSDAGLTLENPDPLELA